VFEDMDVGVMIAVIVGPLVILAAGLYFLIRALSSRTKVIHYARCPNKGCGQKVRYVPARAGQPAMCPRCKQQFNLPMTPQPLPKSRSRLVPGTRKAEQGGAHDDE
jgi:hypothetical protein